MPMGRPTKYTKQLLKAAWEYLDNYEEAGDLVPSVVGLAISLGITKSTCYVWAEEAGKEEFSDILTRVSDLQEQKLMRGGLSGEYNPAITKMMMTKHGYSDAQKVDMSSTDGTMTPKGMDHFYSQDAGSDEE